MPQHKDPLYQVWATERETGKMVPVPFFPKVIAEAADVFVGKMAEMIAVGKERRYIDPRAVPVLGFPT